jgi:hypothetical protein
LKDFLSADITRAGGFGGGGGVGFVIKVVLGELSKLMNTD